MGSLTPEKGLDVLLQALPFLTVRHPRLGLCIVGDGRLRASLQDLARELGLQERVFFAGAQTDVRPWLAAFDLFLMPSRREGMGIAILEAMAMGKPVVASRTGGIPEVVIDGRTGVLVPPDDPRILAAAVEGLLQDGARCRTLAQAGRRHVAQAFDLESMLRRLEQEYENLLAAKKAPR